MRQTVDLNQLEIHYQFQVDARDGRTLGAEVLVRLGPPEKGLIPSVAFMPLAEETGIIVAFGNQVLEQKCRTWAGLAESRLACREWR